METLKKPRKCTTAVVTEREFLSKMCSQGTSMDDDFLPPPAYQKCRDPREQKNQNSKTNKTGASTEKKKSANAMPSRRGLQMLLQVCSVGLGYPESDPKNHI